MGPWKPLIIIIFCHSVSFNNLQKLNSRLDTCIELIVLQFFAKILKKVLSFFSNLPFLPALSNTLSDTFRNFGGFSVIKISAGKIRGISQSGSLDISEFWIRIRIILCKPHFHQSALKDPELQDCRSHKTSLYIDT